MRRRLPSLAPALTAPGAPLVAGAALLVTAVSAHWAGMAQVPMNPLRLDLDEGRYPTRTMAFIRENRLPPRLFSVYAWGGYELFRLYPEYRMFMDGRTHVYGPEVLKEFLDVVNVSPRWQTVLDKWQVQTILALRASPLTETLRAQGGWRLVFNEREAVVFVRETDANRPLLARLARQSRETVPDQEETADRRPMPGSADPVVVTWVPVGKGTRWVRNIVHVLGKIGDDAAFNPVVRLLGHPHVRVRIEALRTLALMAPARAARPMLPLSRDADPEVRLEAVHAPGVHLHHVGTDAACTRACAKTGEHQIVR